MFRIEVGSGSVPLVFARNRKARRYILRVLPAGEARVTIPRGGTVEHGLDFARKNAAWIEKQLRRTPSQWEDGTEVWFRGVPVTISVTPGQTGTKASVGEMNIEVAPGSELREAIEARLKMIALTELPVRVLEIALEHGLEVRSVQVRDQRSRWGSCSLRKTISLNWRLVQTPEFVRDYIIIHELMHLREMNHSAKFWRHVEAACPKYLEAERWLRKHSRLLR